MLQDLAWETGQTGESRFSIISSKKRARRIGNIWGEKGAEAEGCQGRQGQVGAGGLWGTEALHGEDTEGEVKHEDERERRGDTWVGRSASAPCPLRPTGNEVRK